MDNKDKEMYTLDDLKELLDQNNIENEFGEDIYEDDDGKEEKYKFLVFQFPIARDCESIKVYEDDELESIILSDFIKYRGVNNYEAIWSSDLKKIECEIQCSNNAGMPSRIFMKRLAKYLEVIEERKDERDHSEPLNCLLYADDSIKVHIGYSSKEFAFLSGYKEGRRIGLSTNNRFRITLKIENIKVTTEEDARKKLEKIANSVFYQLDVLYELLITLIPRRETQEERRRKLKEKNTKELELRDIRLDYEYDEIPMSLYWLAEKSSDSPIFMYFAFYQVLEFYYPIYATVNIKTQIQNLIKDPMFNVNKDADVVRLFNIMKTNGVGDFGDEREQLSITLRNVISGEGVNDFISEHQYLYDYFKGKDSNKISDKKLRITDNIGIIDDLAQRIYDIRCRIVHNKASEISKKIVPTSKNVDYLKYDLELLKFIARKTIIANSRPFTMN